MKKYLKYLVILGLIGAVAFFITWFIVFKKSDLSVKNSKAEYQVEASFIISQFETNEELANQQYLGKVIIVSGKLESIKETDTDVSLYLKQDNDLSGILCNFDKSVIDLSKTNIGSTIKVKGICTGYLIDVVMNKCSIVE